MDNVYWDKLTFHTGPAAQGGKILDYALALAEHGHAVKAMVVNDWGMAHELFAIADTHGVRPDIVFRWTVNPTNVPEVPNYDIDPQVAAWDHFTAYQQAIAKQNTPPDPRMWFSPINEVDQERSEWLAQFALHCAGHFRDANLKSSWFAWATGNPHVPSAQTPGYNTWLQPNMAAFLTNISQAPDWFAVDVHEYSLDDHLSTHWGWLWGRTRFLFDACDELGIAYPRIHIKEAGWRLNWVPTWETGINELAPAVEHYHNHDCVQMIALWALQGGKEFNPVQQKLATYVEPLASLAASSPISPGYEGGSGPGPGPGPSPGDEILHQGLFNIGHYHRKTPTGQDIPELQIPTDVWVNWLEGDHTLEDGEQVTFVRPEIRTLPLDSQQLPPEEWDLFYGPVDPATGQRPYPSIVKVFKGWGAIMVPFILPQSVQYMGIGDEWQTTRFHLDPGWYKFSIQVLPDLVEEYTNDGKIFAKDAKSGEYRIYISGWRSEWKTLAPYGKDFGDPYWEYIDHEFEVKEGEEDIAIGVDLRGRHALKGNNFWIRAASLVPLQEPGPGPIPQYRKEFHLLPQTITPEEAQGVLDLAYPNRNTLGWSADDAVGIMNLPDTRDDSKVVVYWPQRWNDDIVQWLLDKGVPNVETVFDEVPPTEFSVKVWPVDHTIKQINQEFGRIGNYPSFGLPGHEGCDLFAPHGTRIFAVDYGTISRLEPDPNSGNYGIHVRLQHTDGYKTGYCHLEAINPDLHLGKSVKPGDVLGWADDTGNSYGSHLHFFVKKEGQTTLCNYPYNFIDPTPFLLPHSPSRPYSDYYMECAWAGSGDALFGIHASADSGDYPSGDFAKYDVANFDCVKVMSSHTPGHIYEASKRTKTGKVLIRAFLHIGDRYVTPQEFFDWTWFDVNRSIAAVGADNVIGIEIHNEPNLVNEGLFHSWQNGYEFNSWFLEVLGRYRTAWPDVPMLYPGCSPGLAIPNTRQQQWEFAAQSVEAIAACDGLCIHAYWSDLTANWTFEKALEEIDIWLSQYPDKAIHVTEYSRNAQNKPPLVKAQEYIDFHHAMLARPQVKSHHSFVLSASNPIWGWGEGGSGETWTQEMAIKVGNR